MSGSSDTTLSDVRALAEALADVLAERGFVVAGMPAPPTRVLDAAQVGLILGRHRHWVYDHADELGGFRYGDGPKARLGFDLAAVERWKRERQMARTDAHAATRPRRSRTRRASRPELIPYEAAG